MDEQTGPEIDRSIYGMPMFANFTVKNLAAAESFYNAIGFITLATFTGMDGDVQLVHLRRMKYQDILVTASTLGGRGTPITFAAGDEELDMLAERAKELPGAKVAGPVDTLWFTTDVTIDDPDGNRIIFTARRMAEQADSMKWARQNISGDFEVPMSSPDPAK
jgi:predicted lactoylglutathione lyase